MPQTRTFEDAAATAPKARTFEMAVGTPRYEQNVRAIFARTEELRTDTQAQQTYVRDYWKQQGAALAKSDVRFHDKPMQATTHLLRTTGRETLDRVQTEKSKEWQTVARDRAVGEFFSKRKQLANALWNQVHLADPEISEENAYQHMHQHLAMYGYQPPGAGQLPPLVMQEGQWENAYTLGWTEFRSLNVGITKGWHKLIHAAPKLHVMAGEAVHDAMHQETMGAEVHGTNTYRDARHRMEIDERYFDQYVRRGVGDVPYLPEGFNLYEILGEQLPQFTMMAGTGQAVASGLVTKFLGRTATAATMFALETTDAYSTYMQYAEDKGMDPRTASQIAAGGAVVYGAVASVLETYGPFELLSKQNPKAFGRITRGAIMSLAEGGTEFTQAMTQHAIAEGLDLKEMDWDSIRSAMGEAVAGMIMGGAIGVTQPGGPVDQTTPPQIAGPGMSIDPGEMGPATEVAEAPAVTPEVVPTVTPEVEAPSTLTRDAVIEHMVETTPEAERTDMTYAAFDTVIDTLRYGQESFIEVDVPISQLDLNLLGQEETEARRADITKYAAQEAVTVPAVVAGSVDESGTFMVVDGVRRVQAAQQRGDTTVKVLVPQTDAETIQPVVSVETPTEVPVEEGPIAAPTATLAQQMQEIARGESPEAIARRQQEIEAETKAETKLVKKSVSLVQKKLGREGSRITDSKSLAEVGMAIAEIVGLDPEVDITWQFKTDPNLIGVAGLHQKLRDGTHKITIRNGTKYKKGAEVPLIVAKHKAQAGVKPGQVTPSKTNIYRIIVHELGHIAKPPIEGGPFAADPRRKIHYQEYVDWVEEGITKLIGTTYVQAPDIEPLSTPENVPMAEDMKPAPTEPDEAPQTVGGVVKSLLADEDGYWNPQATGRVIEGGITVASEGAGSILTGVTALTDEAAFLHRTDAGTLADELFSDAQAKAQRKIGEHNSKFLKTYDKLTTEEKRWLEHIRADGQTNWATLREHPERLEMEISDAIQALDRVAMEQQKDSAQGAIDSRLPQARTEVVIGPQGGKTYKQVVGVFKPAKGGRYSRILTPKGAAAIHSQAGPVFEALVEWLEEHADRNPDLPDKAADIRKKLAGERASGRTRQAGSLEYTRVFKEVPTALKVNGKWETFQDMRPVNHFMTVNESQWRRITFWDVIQDRLLTRYGKYSEKTGETTLPHPKNPELTDVDGLVDRLRKDVVQQEGHRKRGNPKGAEQSYNRMLQHYFRQFSGGVMEEVFTLGDRDNRLMQVASIVDRNVMSSILSFSGLWDVCQPTASAHIVGYRRLTKAYAKVMAEVLAHPTEYSAEYQAMGAVSLRHHDYMLRKTRRELTGGVLERTLPQMMMQGAEAMEQWAQTVTATAFDLWSRDANGSLSDADARMLRKHLRLTDAEVLEVAQGQMSDATRAKIIQNGVKTTNYLAEDPMHRGLLQNVPLLRFMVPFTSVVSGNLRAAGRVVTDVVEDVQRIKKGDKGAVKDLLKDLGKMMSFLVACFGRGFVQNMLRRTITGKPLLRPEEEDDWAGTLFECLGEGAVFGPYWRLLEAAKYSGGDPNRMAVNMLPRAAIWIEMITALSGTGKYEGTAWGKRMEKWGYKISPAARSFKNWHDKMIHPGRADYKEVRSRVRMFLETEGEEPKRGFGPTNRYYYAIFEAVRDQNDVTLDKVLAAYKGWAQEKGKTSEEARTALRSALHARRPMNLREERIKKFLAGLTEPQREMAEQQQREYVAWVDRVTRRPGVKRRRKKVVKRKKRQQGGDWYVTE